MTNAQALESIYELSRLLNTGLDRETLAILIQLIQQGVNPEALAKAVRDLRADAATARQEDIENTIPITQQQLQKEPLKKQRSEY